MSRLWSLSAILVAAAGLLVGLTIGSGAEAPRPAPAEAGVG